MPKFRTLKKKGQFRELQKPLIPQADPLKVQQRESEDRIIKALKTEQKRETAKEVLTVPTIIHKETIRENNNPLIFDYEKLAKLFKDSLPTRWVGGGGGAFSSLRNAKYEAINPATQEKQDLIASNLNKTEATRFLVRSDNVNICYIGKAVIASATSAAVWKIKRLDETTGIVITWADGNSSYDNVWDNRESLTYL